jgi:hypothetical protein
MGMISRRNLIKTASAIPAVAMIPAAAALPLAPAVLVAGPVAVLKPAYPWKWWVTHDREVYHESFETRDEALEYASGCGYAEIAECQQQDFSLEIEPWRVLEMLQDDNEELVGDGDFFSCTNEQEKDLGKMLTATMYAWADKHNINLTAWTFGETRNHESAPPAPAKRSDDSTEAQATKDKAA